MADDWQDKAARLGPHAPVEIDPVLPQAGKAPAAGGWLERDDPATAPAAALFRSADAAGDGAAIGIRLNAPPADPAWLAGRLLAIEAERGIRPIILSGLPVCGLERFGFRIERIPPDEAGAVACEAELTAFWNIALVIDAGQIGQLL